MLGNCYLFLFVVSALVSVLDSQSTGDGPGHDKVVVCYIGTWAAYRTPPGDFQLGDVDPHVCTHLVYSFAGLNPNDYTIRVLDPWQDLPDGGGKAGYQRLVSLKKNYRHLKVTIAIGGWNEGSLQYSLMADSPEHRGRFVDSVVKFLQKHEFDGLDLDWEYPTKRDGRPQDKANYVTLVRQLKEAFRPHGYILTAALGVGKDTMDSAYDLPKLAQYLDLIHMMCYDYHGKWDGVVGANAPLRGMNDNDTLSVEYSIQYMLRHGVNPSKLVLGLPMYGRTFLLTDPETRVIEFGRTPSVNGFAGPLTKEVGFMGYNEICREISNKSSTWSVHWHRQSETPYIHDGNKVVTYDNERSLASKVKMAMEYGLRGLMVWSIDTDDFKGACGMKNNEAFVDFEVRAQKLAHDPLLKKALPNVRMPDISSERSTYVITGDKLELKIVQPKVSNYPLMRTINDATRLAMQEKKLLDAMNKITRHNEVEQREPYRKPGGGASGFNGSFLLVVIGAVVGTSFFKCF